MLSPANAGNLFFGDSQTSCNSAYALCYPWLFSAIRGQNLSVLAVSGSQAPDQYQAIYSHTPVSGDVNFYMIGSNDAPWYNTSTKRLVFKNSLMAEVYWLASNKTVMKGGGCTETGLWGNEGISWGVGRFTQELGATCSTSFNGETFILGYTVADGVSGQFSITIDGVAKGCFNTVSPATIHTRWLNATLAPAIIRLTGLGSGSHSVVITNMTTAPIFIDWIWGGSNGLPLYLMTPPKMNATGYSNFGGTDADFVAIAGIMSDVVTQAQADGLNVTLVDVQSLVDVNRDLNPDGIHLNLIGQSKPVIALQSAVP